MIDRLIITASIFDFSAISFPKILEERLLQQFVVWHGPTCFGHGYVSQSS